MHSRFTILVALAVLVGPLAATAGDSVKTFPAYQCRYTLPDNGWAWADPNPKSGPEVICVARNHDGVRFVLAVVPAPTGAAIDARFSEEFDKNTAARLWKKRGGRLTTFMGLPCYESEWLVLERVTAVIRVMITNGWQYQLQLIRKGDSVEKGPDFEAIINGFEFTTPSNTPAPKSAADAPDDNKNPAYVAGQVLAYCLIGVFLLRLATGGKRRK